MPTVAGMQIIAAKTSDVVARPFPGGEWDVLRWGIYNKRAEAWMAQPETMKPLVLTTRAQARLVAEVKTGPRADRQRWLTLVVEPD